MTPRSLLSVDHIDRGDVPAGSWQSEASELADIFYLYVVPGEAANTDADAYYAVWIRSTPNGFVRLQIDERGATIGREFVDSSNIDDGSWGMSRYERDFLGIQKPSF